MIADILTNYYELQKPSSSLPIYKIIVRIKQKGTKNTLVDT